MDLTHENLIKRLIENSNKINSKVFNITRCAILALTLYIRDGLQYREFKTLLNISDGKLQSDLENLREMGYIQKIKVELDKKIITIYMITEFGIKELEKISSWINVIELMSRNNNV